MKAIFLVFDSLNRRYLPPYGNDWVDAPNFRRLAERCVTFDNAYVGSLPCMPARRDFHTGRLNFLHRSWGPIEPFDDSLPELLKRNGVYSHLVTDHYHYFEDGGGTYHTRYSSWEAVRGQEWDPWKGEVQDPNIPETVVGLVKQRNRQNWINRKHTASIDCHTQTTTFKHGLEFLKQNAGQDNWFLQIESFDPHEPFFLPEDHTHSYVDNYDGPVFDWPEYRAVSESADEIEHVRLQYAKLLSMCDTSLGKVMTMMDELEMWDDTLLIVSTDHGYLLGEHGWWAKNRPPVYDEIARIPLFVWDPRFRKGGERRNQLVQWIDFAPTILSFFGLPCPADIAGFDIGPVISANAHTRDYALFGMYGGYANITDGRYVYMRSPLTTGNQPLYEYTLMPIHAYDRFSVDLLRQLQPVEPFSFTKACPLFRIPGSAPHDSIQHEFPTMLFDLESDSSQADPVSNPEVEMRMIQNLIRLMQENDAPDEQYQRLGLDRDNGTEIR